MKRRFIACFIVFALLIAIPAGAVRLNREEGYLGIGETGQLKADQSVTWSSSDNNIATVSDSGLVTAVSGGTAYITAKTEDGQTAVAKIEVSSPVFGVAFEREEYEIYIEEGPVKLNAVLTPLDTTQTKLLWKSEDESVFTVDQTGLVTPVSEGVARVGVKCENGDIAIASVHVTYKDPFARPVEVVSVGFESDEYTLYIDEGARKLGVTYIPENTTQRALEWRSENTGVFTVDNEGTATPVAPGQARVGIRCQSGEIAVANVYVKSRATSIGVSEQNVAVRRYEKAQVTANVLPESATDRSVKWTTSDPLVATVTENGAIYGRGEGKCIITATANGGEGLSQLISVVVSPNPDVQTKYIALTFDDGPKEKTTPRVLDILAQYDIKATFFMVGVKAKNNPDLAFSVFSAGHQIGNHTYQHQNLKTSSTSEARSYVDAADEVFLKLFGEYPKVLRAPGGSLTAERAKQIGGGRYFVYWTVDSRDWESQDADSIYKVTMRDVRDGAVLLYHDTQSATVEALPRLLDALVRQGYEFMTVTDLMAYTGTGETMIYKP